MLRVLVAAALTIAGLLVAPTPGAATTTVSQLGVHQHLAAGTRLVSPHATAYATVSGPGRLVVSRADGTLVWASPSTAATPGAYAYVGATGNLVLAAAGQARWSSHTSGSGAADTLVVTDAGELRLRAGRLLVWTSRTGYLCGAGGPAKWGVVDVSRQLMGLCQYRQQVRVTAVTTGASALGMGTPTGTWHVLRKVRDTTLYPAAGGAYPVQYWVPYDGPYGLHDSSWQTFPYGSSRYRTEGSHGCVHVPLRAMAWFFDWVRIGTRITVHP
jgi:lipoprotein-anchoring transpeptidase ErfK/SrfK